MPGPAKLPIRTYTPGTPALWQAAHGSWGVRFVLLGVLHRGGPLPVGELPPPVVGIHLCQGPRLPPGRIAFLWDGDLHCRPPKREPLLTDTAGRKDQNPASLHIPADADADGGDDGAVLRIGLDERPGLLTQRN